jgi:hypothetical protein
MDISSTPSSSIPGIVSPEIRQTTSASDVERINRRLEETRRQLRQSSLGLEFLIGILEDITATAKRQGYLSVSSERLLLDACESGGKMLQRCVKHRPDDQKGTGFVRAWGTLRAGPGEHLVVGSDLYYVKPLPSSSATLMMHLSYISGQLPTPRDRSSVVVCGCAIAGQHVAVGGGRGQCTA